MQHPGNGGTDGNQRNPPGGGHCPLLGKKFFREFGKKSEPGDDAYAHHHKSQIVPGLLK
jgi:hypothetical protein